MSGLAGAAGINVAAAAGPIWVTLIYLGLYYVFLLDKRKLTRYYPARCLHRNATTD